MNIKRLIAHWLYPEIHRELVRHGTRNINSVTIKPVAGNFPEGTRLNIEQHWDTIPPEEAAT